MAFSTTLVDRISFGNMKLRLYTLTDVAAAGSTFETGMSTTWAVKASDNTRATESFKEVCGNGTTDRSNSTTRSQVKFTAPTALDDGHAWIWGR